MSFVILFFLLAMTTIGIASSYMFGTMLGIASIALWTLSMAADKLARD